MVKLVDTLASGASGLTAVEVRVFSWAPIQKKPSNARFFQLQEIAQVVKLVDTLASGASDLTVVEVRVFSWAPIS